MTRFDLTFNELVVFFNDEEIETEKENLESVVNLIRHTLLSTGLKTVFGELTRFIKLPMTPFSELERCMGIKASNSIVKINEGYVNFAFDYTIKKPINKTCLSKEKKSSSSSSNVVADTIT